MLANTGIFYKVTLLEAGLGLVALGIGLAVGHNPLSGIRFGGAEFGLGALTAIPPVLALASMRRSRLPGVRHLVESARTMVREFLSPLTWPRVLLIAAAAGFGEELLFRGLLQPLLALQFGVVPALIATSIVFGLLHFLSKAYVVFAFVFSLYLGVIYLLSGNILVPMLAHGIYDAVALWSSAVTGPAVPTLPAE
ncbi:MAG: CPBP family intramembrane metalloprotease [Spirochaetaceae bacterium]|nr:MAG: CPBP family intramembrane metalloprotease [Spirochaetaceae bacterium]